MLFGLIGDDSIKVINDAIHGQFRIDGVREELLKTPEMNKLSHIKHCLLYTSPSPRDRTRSRMPSSA